MGARRRHVIVLLALAGTAVGRFAFAAPSGSAQGYAVTRSVVILGGATSVAVDEAHHRQFVMLEHFGGDPGAGGVARVDDDGATLFATAGSPTGIAYDPDHDHVVAASTGGSVAANQIEAFDATTGAGVASFAIQSVPAGVAVDRDVGHAYVALRHAGLFGSDGLSTIDTETFDPGDPVAVGGRPRDVVVDPSNHRVYVTAVSTSGGPAIGVLTVLDGTGPVPTVLGSVAIGNVPVALAIDPGTQRAFVVDARASTLQTVDVHDPAAMQVIGATDATGAFDVAVDAAAGVLFLTGSQGVRVLGTADLAELGSLAVAGGAVGAATDPTAHEAFVTAGQGTLLTIAREAGASAAPTTTASPAVPAGGLPTTTVRTAPPTTTVRAAPPTTADAGVSAGAGAVVGTGATAGATSPSSTTTSGSSSTTTSVTTGSTAPGPTAGLAGGPPLARPPAVAAGPQATEAPALDAAASLIAAVAAPDDVPFGLRAVVPSALWAIVLLALLRLPIAIVNKTAEINADALAVRVAWLTRRLRLSGVADAVGRWSMVGATAGAAVAGAVLYGTLQEGFGLDLPSLALVLGTAAALAVLNGLSNLVVVRHLRLAFATDSYVRALPGFVLVALACVVASRAVGLQPGLLVGPLLAVQLVTPLDRPSIGEAKAWSWLLVAGLAVVAWLVRGFALAHAGPAGGFEALLLGTFLTTTTIAGVQGLAFGLLPLYFLDGSQILERTKAGWAALELFGVFGVVHVLVRAAAPTPGLADRTRELAVMLAVYLLLSLWFWAWFRFRIAPPPAPTATPEPVDEPSLSHPPAIIRP